MIVSVRARFVGALLLIGSLAAGCSSKSTVAPPPPPEPQASSVIGLVRSGDSSAVYVGSALPSGSGGTPVVTASDQFVRGGAALLLLEVPDDATRAFVGVVGHRGHYELHLPPPPSLSVRALARRKRAPFFGSAMLAAGTRQVPLVLQPFDSVDSLEVEISTAGPSAVSRIARHVLRAASAAEGSLQVSLSWAAPVDLDLHLATPEGDEIYYGARTSGSGGSLDLDSNAACDLDGVDNENITWPNGSAPAGEYVARVDLWSACAVTGRIPYVVSIRRCGQTETFNGEVDAGEADEGGAGAGRVIRTFTNTAPIRTVDFWIKAFIPRDIPGYTVTVPTGTYAGKTVIPHPVLDYDYLTDQRGFSSSPTASARLTSSVHLDFTGGSPTWTETQTCGTTVELSGSTWTSTCTSTASTSRMHFRNLRRSGDVVQIDVVGAAANPCSNAATYIAGDIDYQGALTIDLARSTVRFDGLVDSFPWFEAYASINGGGAKTLFNQMSAPSATVMSLVGDASVPVTGSATAECNASGSARSLGRSALAAAPWKSVRQRLLLYR